jgi:fucose permease
MITIDEGFLGYEGNSVDCKQFLDCSLIYLMSGLACLTSLHFLKILDRSNYYIFTALIIYLIIIIVKTTVGSGARAD